MYRETNVHGEPKSLFTGCCIVPCFVGRCLPSDGDKTLRLGRRRTRAVFSSTVRVGMSPSQYRSRLHVCIESWKRDISERCSLKEANLRLR